MLMPLTVKVTLAVLERLRLLLVTVHVPALPVVQEPLPLAPLLQLPLTVAPDTGAFDPLCTVIVTVALHLLDDWLDLLATRLPMCIGWAAVVALATLE